MAQPSPTIEGFRAAFRRPGITLAEISWRWSFGAAVLALLTLSVFEFLDTLPVSREDRLFMRTGQPFLVSHAVGHILRGSTPRVVTSLLILAVCLAVLWILAASFGRAATVGSLLAYFSPQSQSGDGDHQIAGMRERRGRIRSLFGLNALRVALSFAALLALAASGVIAGFASSEAHPHPGLVFLIFACLALLVAVFWSCVSWFLSIAPIFVLQEACDVFGSLSAAVDFCRRQAGPVFWSSSAFGVLHLIVFVAATSVVVFPLAFAGIAPAWLVVAAILVLTLMYFAVVDFLYTGRMAAYVCILQQPLNAEPVVVVPPPTPLTDTRRLASGRSPAWYGTDDDILSDVPGLIAPDEPPESST